MLSNISGDGRFAVAKTSAFTAKPVQPSNGFWRNPGGSAPVRFGLASSVEEPTPKGKKSKNVVLNSFQELKRMFSVSVYGSASTRPGDGFFEHAEKVGQALGNAGFHVVTGGGPASMRQVAAGALAQQSPTTGLAMDFIGEEPSADVHSQMLYFTDFFKRMSTFESTAAKTAAVPGGIGTLMELTSILTKLVTGHVSDTMHDAVVLFDYKDVFKNWKQNLADNFVKHGLMSADVLDRMVIFDEHHIEEGVRFLKNHPALVHASPSVHLLRSA
jgi:uncharacterized protein (TIGR00730 family)